MENYKVKILNAMGLSGEAILNEYDGYVSKYVNSVVGEAPRLTGTSQVQSVYVGASMQYCKDVFGGGNEYFDNISLEITIPEVYKDLEEYKPFVQLYFLSTRFGNKIRALPNPDGCVIQPELDKDFAPRYFKNKTSNYTFPTQKKIEFNNGVMNRKVSFTLNPAELFGTFSNEEQPQRNTPPFKFPILSTEFNNNPSIAKNLRVINSSGSFYGSKKRKIVNGGVVDLLARPKSLVVGAKIVMLKSLQHKSFTAKACEIRGVGGAVLGVKPERAVSFYEASFSNISNLARVKPRLNQMLSGASDNFYYGWSCTEEN